MNRSMPVGNRWITRAFVIGAVLLVPLVGVIFALGIRSQAEFVGFRTGEDRNGPMRAVAFCPDGKEFVTADSNEAICIWDTSAGKEKKRFRRYGLSLAVSPSGRHLLVDLNDGREPNRGMIALDIDSGKEVRRFVGNTGRVRRVVFSPDGRQVISGSADKTVRVYDFESGREIHQLLGHGGEVNDVAVSPDGKFVISAGGDYGQGELHDASVRLWDLGTGKESRIVCQGSVSFESVGFSADGRLAASGDWKGVIRVWETTTWSEVKTMTAGLNVNSLVFSPDSIKLLTGCGRDDTGTKGGTVKLWNVKSGEDLGGFAGPLSASVGVAFSADGKTIVSTHGYVGGNGRMHWDGAPMAANFDCVIRVWDTETRTELRQIGIPSASKH